MDRLKVVKLNEPLVVEGVTVTYLEANHCPGSAMILFQVPGRRAVLHTGDCRQDHSSTSWLSQDSKCYMQSMIV